MLVRTTSNFHPFHRFACPLLSRPSRSLRGGVVTVVGLPLAAKATLRAPPPPFFLSCTFRLGNRSKQLAFVSSTAAVQQRKRQHDETFLFMASTLFCHALRQQAFVFRGQGSGRRKNAKIRRSVEDSLKIKMQG